MSVRKASNSMTELYFGVYGVYVIPAGDPLVDSGLFATLEQPLVCAMHEHLWHSMGAYRLYIQRGKIPMY